MLATWSHRFYAFAVQSPPWTRPDWRKRWWQWALPLGLGLLLRLRFVHHNPDLSGDPLIYGAVARNLLQHGVYGIAPDAPTLIRLPGYPLFLAACFRLFGVEHYYPVLWLQVGLDLAGCCLLARLASLLAAPTQRRRAALWTLWLACLCPFTACYTAAPLTETLELFSISAALLCFARALRVGEAAGGFSGRWLIPCVLWWTYAALLRPDGALLGVTLCVALIFYSNRAEAQRHGLGIRPGLSKRRGLGLAAAGAFASLLAFAPWAWRNWHTFHVFEPLAPRYATDPGERTNPGFQRWTKTVCADLVCTIEVYWAADDAPIAIDDLPSRAFDSGAEWRETADLLRDYNRDTTLTATLDARFDALARERIAAHPVRYYVGLPLLRLADMWFRPRVELFNIDPRWWRYGPEGPDTVLAWGFAVLNAAYLALALAGASRRPPLLAVFAGFVLLRCALLLTIEAPEPRYTLECYPVVLVLGGLALARRRAHATSGSPASLSESSA